MPLRNRCHMLSCVRRMQRAEVHGSRHILRRVWPSGIRRMRGGFTGRRPLCCALLLVVGSLPAVVSGGDAAESSVRNPVISGDAIVWHTVTITFDGPATDEIAEPNPFTDCRLDVVFRQADKRFIVPGYFAADGAAANTGATKGNKWQVNFVPNAAGTWEYDAIFATGPAAAVAPFLGGPAAANGKFVVAEKEAEKQADPGDHRSKGFLRHQGGRYYQYAGTGEYYLKGGADSPENFLAYADFDDTFDTDGLARGGEAKGDKFIHRYKAHEKDWCPGDPTWRNDRGKGIIGRSTTWPARA